MSGRGEFELYGSGRTDAGVHALAQVAHLELYTSLPPETLRRRLNDELPADIHIIAIDKAPHRFHARHDARLAQRTSIRSRGGGRHSPSRSSGGFASHSISCAMRAAAAAFVGRQDFAAYSDDDPDEKSTVVVVDRVEIVEAGALLLVRVQGSHFIWKMVRRIVGVLVAVGQGGLEAGRCRAVFGF